MDVVCPYHARMDNLTVSEIAQRVAPAGDNVTVERITRQLRHWTLERVIEPVGGLHKGPGRHRRYSGDAVYIAAVMVELSNLGLPVGVLFLMASLIKFGVLNPPKIGLGRKRLPKSELPDLWRRAIKGEGQICMFFSPSFGADDDQEPGELGFGMIDAEDGIDLASSDHTSNVVVNLTRLFAPLRA